MGKRTLFIANNNCDILNKFKQEFAEELVEVPGAYAIQHKNVLDFLSKNMLGTYPKKDKKMQTTIINKLNEHFEETDFIDLQGFEHFRLKEERAEIENEILETKLQEEYQDFVSLLRYFIAIEEPKEEEIEVFVDETSNYKVLNGNKKDVTKKYSEEFTQAKNDGIVNSGDVLISMLVNISPKSLKIHNIDNLRNKDLKKTIINVFGDRMLQCCGCNNCE